MQQIMKAAPGEIEFLTTRSSRTTLDRKNKDRGGQAKESEPERKREQEMLGLKDSHAEAECEKKGKIGPSQLGRVPAWPLSVSLTLRREAFQHINITLPHKETQTSAGPLTHTNKGSHPLLIWPWCLLERRF